MPTSTTTSSSSSSSSSSSYLMKNPLKSTAKKSGGRGKGLFAFTCGCKDSKSMCVTPSRSDSSISTPTTATTSVSNLRRHGRLKSDTSAAAMVTSTNFLSVNRGEQHRKSNQPDDVMEKEEEQILSTSTSPSFSSLLRELVELEQSLNELDHSRNSIGKRKEEVQEEEEEEEVRFELFGEMRRRLGSEKKGSVAIVTETEDPVGDFRKSMVLMIEENDIDTEEELKDLVSQFLALNSPENHHLILHAFADVCEDFFPR